VRAENRAARFAGRLARPGCHETDQDDHEGADAQHQANHEEDEHLRVGAQERADRSAAVGIPIATYVRTATVRFPGVARVRHPVAFVHHAVLKKKPAATYSPRPLRAKYHRR
jgi:hypothetical protein